MEQVEKKLSGAESQRVQTYCLLILTGLACTAAAYWLKAVLLPFVFSVFLALVLSPIVDLLNKKLRLPRVLSIILTLILGGLILVGLTIVVSNSVVDLTSNVESYEEKIVKLVDDISNNKWLQKINFKRTDVLNTIGKEAANSVGNAITAVFGALFSMVSNIVIVGIYLIFLLFGNFIAQDSGSESEQTLMYKIRKSIEYYVLVKTLISLVVGVLTWLILSLLHVKMAYVLGLLTFALNFIPNVGPIVSVILPLPLVLLSPESTLTTFALVVILPTIVHLVSGHLVEPNVIGDSLELDPVVILLTLVLAGVIWGPMGMLLATPMTVACKMVIDKIGWARPVASLISGRRVVAEEKEQQPKKEEQEKESQKETPQVATPDLEK
ncbi:AI-2E family transporter [bacterium]|nr:AI-2E family transporter [bacterium]